MLKLNLQYFGHLMWRAGALEKSLMLEEIEGKRREGGSRGDVNDRESWSAAVCWVLKSCTWLSNWTTRSCINNTESSFSHGDTLYNCRKISRPRKWCSCTTANWTTKFIQFSPSLTCPLLRFLANIYGIPQSWKQLKRLSSRGSQYNWHVIDLISSSNIVGIEKRKSIIYLSF